MTCGRKLNSTQVQEIISLLKSSNKTSQEISTIYNVSESVINMINNGKRYHQENMIYPIRDRINKSKYKKLNNDEFLCLVEEITNTDIPFSQLSYKYGISTTTVYNINNGTTRFNKNYNYPLRK